jgi:replicative DNA helicase
MGCQIAMTNAIDGKRVQFFSLEMSKELIVEKLEKQLINDRVFERDHKKIVEKASLQDFKISDESNFTKIASICRSESRIRKIDLVVIDYVQIIRDNDLPVTTPDLDKIPIVMERINSLAKELHCPIITMAQLNRAGEKEFRAPILADLAGSSAIEKWAHRVIMLYRPVKDENGNEIDLSASPNLTIVQLPKNRNSSKMKQYMLYSGEVGIFKEKLNNNESGQI